MNWDAMIKELRELKRLREDLDAEIESIEDALKQDLQGRGVEEMKGSDWKVTWHSVQSQRVDTTALKKALPDIAKQFIVTSATRRFIVK